MSKLDRLPSSRHLLTRLLETPDLVASVQALPPESLAGLVRRVGVEDAGEILSLVTADQLVDLFDSELWQQEGSQEQLAPERFALWLEVLFESGPTFVANRLAALPDELLAHALDGQLLVLDLDALVVAFDGRGMDDALDKALTSPLSYELDQYLLLSKRYDGWDAVLGAVLALDEAHPNVLRPVIERLCAAAMEQVDDSGLYTVLTEAESLAEDAVAEREERRATRGYVSAADAHSFESLVDHPEALFAHPVRDGIAKAYFRRLDRSPAPPPPPSALDVVLAQAGVGRARTPPLLGESGVGSRELRQAMQQLAEVDPQLHAERLEELAFLANVIVVAAVGRGQSVRPAAAASAAVATCSRGLGWVLARPDAPAEPLRTFSLDVLYRIGRSVEPGPEASRAKRPPARSRRR